MKKQNLEEIIYESLVVSCITGILNEKLIDKYRARRKAGFRFQEIEQEWYSEYSEDEKW